MRVKTTFLFVSAQLRLNATEWAVLSYFSDEHLKRAAVVRFRCLKHASPPRSSARLDKRIAKGEYDASGPDPRGLAFEPRRTCQGVICGVRNEAQPTIHEALWLRSAATKRDARNAISTFSHQSCFCRRVVLGVISESFLCP